MRGAGECDPLLDLTRNRGGLVRFPGGSILSAQGDQADCVHRLEAGAVKITVCNASGDESIVALRRSPSWLGLESVFGSPRRGVSVTALGPVVSRVLPTAELRELLAGASGAGQSALRCLSEELEATRGALAMNTTLSARERLKRLLRDLLMVYEGEEPVLARHLPIRHWELAQMLGISAGYLCQLFAQLEDEGVVRRDPRGRILLQSASSSCGGR